MNSSNKLLIIGAFIFALLISGSLLLTNQKSSGNSEQAEQTLGTSVINTDGKQIIELTAKGGYSPAILTAKADTETILRVKTTSTFDCSAALTIPSLNYTKMLPPTGTTDIALKPQPNGSKLEGTCSMGMYNFTLNFKS
jgi:hypothetical protein